MASFTIEQSHNLPRIFYVGSYLVMLLLLVIMAAKRKYPLYPFLLILITTALFAVTGGKLASYSIEDWKLVFQEFRFPYTEDKRILGYIFFGFAGLILSRRVLRFDRDIFGLLAIAWPVRLILARLGCLFGGCCYGIPTRGDWGTRYAPSFPAFEDHLHSGLVAGDSGFSLHVHPTQAYEILLGFLILGLVIRSTRKKYFKNSMSLLVLSFAVYGIFRFFIQYLRAGGEFIHGMEKTQWGILLLLAFSAVLLMLSRIRNPGARKPAVHPTERITAVIFLSLALMSIILLLLNWMSPFEVIVCSIMLAMLISGSTIQILKAGEALRWIRVPAALILLSVLFMGQVANVPADTIRTFQNQVIIGFGGMFGEEEETCGGFNEYKAFGGEIGYRWSGQNNQDHYVATEFYRMNYDHMPSFGISPYYEYRGRLLGIGAGFNYSPYFSEMKQSDLFPRASLRLGNKDRFFFEGRFSSHLPTGLPNMQVGVGFRLGPMTPYRDQHILRVGLSEIGFYLNPRFNIQDQLIFDPYFAFGSKDSYQVGLRMYVPIAAGQ